VTESSRHLRVVTANLCKGRAHPEAFADSVAALAPDVVAVQELGPAQAEALGRLLPFGMICPAPRDSGAGMGLLLRREGLVVRFPLPDVDGLLGVVAPDGAGGHDDRVEVLNVHVTAPQVPPFWRTLAHRRRQLQSIRRHLVDSAHPRRLVLGDLNATPMWPLYRGLRPGLTDAAVEAARGNGHRPQPTWGPWPGSRRLLRIDHVLVDGLGVDRVHVVPIVGSDHCAVVADLRLSRTDHRSMGSGARAVLPSTVNGRTPLRA
jgi:endonuclease/exonuclease/phosphatase family metal-dependent hydrolase